MPRAKLLQVIKLVSVMRERLVLAASIHKTDQQTLLIYVHGGLRSLQTEFRAVALFLLYPYNSQARWYIDQYSQVWA